MSTNNIENQVAQNTKTTDTNNNDVKEITV
jgi:hypothetical protein